MAVALSPFCEAPHTLSLFPVFQVAKEFGFRNNGFSVYTNRNRTGEITAAQNKSLNLLKIK